MPVFSSKLFAALGSKVPVGNLFLNIPFNSGFKKHVIGILTRRSCYQDFLVIVAVFQLQYLLLSPAMV